jgi:hypothetical protein
MKMRQIPIKNGGNKCHSMAFKWPLGATLSCGNNQACLDGGSFTYNGGYSTKDTRDSYVESYFLSVQRQPAPSNRASFSSA